MLAIAVYKVMLGVVILDVVILFVIAPKKCLIAIGPDSTLSKNLKH